MAVEEQCLLRNCTRQPNSGGGLSYVLMFLLGVPLVCIILLTVVGNALVLTFKARVGRRNTMLLIWNLGLADFFVGVLVQPCAACYLIFRRWIFGQTLCRVWIFCDVVFCTSSIITICVISADRYLAVTRPLRYKVIVTKWRVIFAMVLIWFVSVTILLLTIRWRNTSQTAGHSEHVCFVGHEVRYLAHSVVFAFFLPAAVTLTLYWRIYRMAQRRQQALDSGMLMLLDAGLNFLDNAAYQQTDLMLRVHYGGRPAAGRYTAGQGVREQQRRVLKTHERVAKTLGVVSCAFLFCWLPFFSLYLANAQCRCVASLVLDVASWLGYFNSTINPIIYAFTISEFKKSGLDALFRVWQLCHKCCPCWLPPAPRRLMRRSTRTLRRHQLHLKKTRSQPARRPQDRTISGGRTSSCSRMRRKAEPLSVQRNTASRRSAATNSNGSCRGEPERVAEPNLTNSHQPADDYSVQLRCLTSEVDL